MINVIYYVACVFVGTILAYNGITPFTWRFYVIAIPTLVLFVYIKITFSNWIRNNLEDK